MEIQILSNNEYYEKYYGEKHYGDDHNFLVIENSQDIEKPGNSYVFCDQPKKNIRAYIDHGAPEDNSFFRDYAWIKNELEAAYNAGYNAGKDGKDGIYGNAERKNYNIDYQGCEG